MSTNPEPGEPAVVTTPIATEIRVERVFDAPRERVFAAFTDPALIPEWWGGSTVVDEMDVRAGGAWRFVARTADGRETAFRGLYREVTPPERLVQTFETEGWGQIHVQMFDFKELGDRTKLTTTMIFGSAEERDGVLRYGGEAGMNESYARLDALFART